MGSHSKLKVGGDGEDKISQLPDAVLSHMLSFLPTKHAVRTSILSTRWKNIWASVPTLDLEHYYCDERRSLHAGFVSSIDRVLYCESSDIQRFRLHYYCLSEDLSRIDGWIRTAIRRNVVELDLCVWVRGDKVEKIELPTTIFLCKTLKLNLESNCFIYAPPESGCFPNLKVLHIGVDCPDKEFMEKLFTFFPLLEDLSIDGRLSSDISGTFKLFVPELKRLRIDIDSDLTFEDPYEYYFSINAPKLEFVNLKMDFLPSIVLDNAKSLVKAVLSFSHHDAIEHEHYDDRATTLLAAISNVQHLSLSVHSLDASCIPAFDNLIHLKLVLHDCHHWEVLAELLHRTPNLERLVLEHNGDVDCDSEREFDSHEERYFANNPNSENEETSEDEENYKGYLEHPWWECEKTAPVCLLSHLKIIVLRGFGGSNGEKEVAKYLLKNGKVLKKMTIYTGDFFYSKEKFHNACALFRKGSKTCRVKFI
uniref:F-box/FBD/LRR-repeat protein At5g22660-like isoform X1 n=1 Tax=Fragaria vesca subsp. vesca TaxID=101020 RepID=UPI0005CAB54B|nr:PREDICTED: F-box/FBD/LRR-repeat protein At5g22660-like isoform X1 [Fragaria vesca subsp. vesca]XP_011462764.1 PREDICTED: F-box/FBD/LRR-repeat protein At5g22660-like isoform X1 [Fragaria vesca subsp. vesca]